MANDVATQATWQINSPTQGNRRLRRAKSWDIGDSRSVEAVNEVGSDVPVAFKVTPGALTISFEIRERVGAKREVDFYKLRDSEEVFSLTRQIVGGMRTQYPECMVSKIDSNGADDQGEIMYTVEIVALREKAL